VFFPFQVPQPHGFTTDIMIQGGASGSPVFKMDDPIVIGMLGSSLLDFDPSQQNTNISIGLPSLYIARAVASMLQEHPLDLTGVPTLQEWKAAHPMKESIEWQAFTFSTQARYRSAEPEPESNG
jgi:S1-C subfamily serine protease